MIDLVCNPENKTYVNLGLFVIYMGIEYWVGRTDKVQAGSTLELIKNAFIMVIKRKK